MKLVEIQNSRLKQYYYDVINELHSGNCRLIKLRSKTMNEFMKGVVCLGLVVILFLLADYLEINSFKDLF